MSLEQPRDAGDLLKPCRLGPPWPNFTKRGCGACVERAQAPSHTFGGRPSVSEADTPWARKAANTAFAEKVQNTRR